MIGWQTYDYVRSNSLRITISIMIKMISYLMWWIFPSIRRLHDDNLVTSASSTKKKIIGLNSSNLLNERRRSQQKEEVGSAEHLGATDVMSI